MAESSRSHLTARWKPGLRSPQHIEDICLDAFEALSIESIQEASITLLRGKYSRGAGSKKGVRTRSQKCGERLRDQYVQKFNMHGE